MEVEPAIYFARRVVLAIAFAGAGAAVWLAYFRWKDKTHPEPKTILVLTGVGGLGAIYAGFMGYRLFDAAGVTATWGALQGPVGHALIIAGVIGVVEEGAKLLPVLLVARFSRHFDELWDGVVYAAASSIGFATAENLYGLYIGEHLPGGVVVRTLTTPLGHSLAAMPWGLGLAAWVLYGKWWAFPLGFAISATAHGLYDFFIAQPTWQFAHVVVVGLLWAALILIGPLLTRAGRVERA